MEIVLIVLVWTVVVKRGVEDLLHAARGGTPHRYAAAKARGRSGAAGRYWDALRDDTFDGMLRRHNERVARRAAGSSSSVPRPRGAATQYFAGLFQDGRRAVRRSWEAGWVRADEKRRERSTRPRPGQDTVPGDVVPNAQDDEPAMYVKDGRDWGNCDTCGQRMVLLPYQSTCAWCTYLRFGGDSNPDASRLTADEAKRWTRGPGPGQDEDGPQDGPGPDPRTTQDEDGRTDLKFGDDPTDPTGTKQCPECDGTGLVDGEICLSCRDRQEQRNQHHDEQEDGMRDAWRVRYPNGQSAITEDGEFYKDRHGYGLTKVRGHDTDQGFRVTHEYPDATPTQEGPTMTATTTEVVGLDSAIRFCEDSARAYRAQIQAIEQTQAALAAGDVTGPAAETFSQAMEQSNAAAASMDAAAAELISHKQVQEAYLANQGAGTRDFILAGQ